MMPLKSSPGPDSVAPTIPAVHERKDVAPAIPAELQNSKDVAAWEEQFRGAAQPGEAANAEPTAKPSAAKRNRRRGTKGKKRGRRSRYGKKPDERTEDISSNSDNVCVPQDLLSRTQPSRNDLPTGPSTEPTTSAQ